MVNIDNTWYQRIFKDFEATLLPWSTDKCIGIMWKNKNGSKLGAIRYILDVEVGNLMISGDYGSCMASWNTQVTPNKLYDSLENASYFSGKIKCSTDMWEFPQDAIKEDLFELGNESYLPLCKYKSLINFLENWFLNQDLTIYTQYPCEITAALKSLNPKWNKRIGQRLSNRVRIWTTCYRMAFAQLQKQKDTNVRNILGNHSSRFELQSKNWILTDDDSCQYRREAIELEKDSGKVFELYQIQAVAASSDPDPAIYKIAHDYVHLSEVDVDSVLECYGYESLDNLKTTYPDDWEAILAESQFELDADCMENLIERTSLLTWQKAKKMIETMIQKRG